ncbi:metallophosphoesterase family protein [Acetivibrio straminisolvens]|jgi:DNA repair exonuclease SbcCD nuclease subunit|uniref:DNA double-strand break repair protein Mre11 n=1 Tax=Acetivibrio straminisolvens JCM 21531 TaxID=1294263 RepID=W4V7P0_9FIRM|nr:metallophosphoesterase [Acetivibrio straminisolvens]GAE89206.1 DNA double-strand break repair protein Mre11 [Acetivibrio straminisolvens JCM 21531]
MKFLFFTDSHIRGTTPKNRKDNFYETLKDKFYEIGDISKQLKVDYILHGGDWFDRPDISPSIVREFAVIIKSFDKPIYTVAGNHDIYGHNPETVGRTMLGLLEGTGIINLLGYDDEVILEKDGITVQLTGKPYNYDIDGENFRDYYIVKKRADVDYAINIVHGMLLLKPFYEGIKYTLLDDIKETQADITFAGHYHSGFGVREINSKYFINPGSIVRVSSSLTELGRRPEVVFLELDGCGIHIEEIELKTARPGDEVLDREKLEAAKDRNLKLHRFYQGIEASEKYKKINISQIVEEIALSDDLSREVKEEALRRIGIARENLSKGQDDE